MWKRIAGIALVTVSLSACAGVMATEGTEHAARSSDALTMSELQGTGVTDAFEAVQRFRPMYLNRLRDMASVSGNQSLVTVYLNDTRLGG
ncbi:MAG: hypothetical protein JWM95_2637, partial [Gemmatimonadetes bacterium]|nr:hypothetical protein [Gemmatimonadota bacterium]